MDFSAKMTFGTPIFSCYVDCNLELISDLQKNIFDLESEDFNSVSRSNQGGWHSDYKMHESSISSFKTFSCIILDYCSTMLQEYYTANQATKFRGITITQLWANINRRGDWNAPHRHLPASWSGVFYLRMPKEQQQSKSRNTVKAGDILFFDPGAPTFMYGRNEYINYSPEENLLFLFPSQLLHMVAPNSSDEPRISIAFNFKANFSR